LGDLIATGRREAMRESGVVRLLLGLWVAEEEERSNVEVVK
jgi:hypothetical protein